MGLSGVENIGRAKTETNRPPPSTNKTSVGEGETKLDLHLNNSRLLAANSFPLGKDIED